MTEENKKLYQMALNKWGVEMQMLMIIEETSELQIEVITIVDSSTTISNFESLIDELADVEIMLEQLQFMFDFEIESIPVNKIEDPHNGLLINIAKLNKEIVKGYRGKGNLENLKSFASNVLSYVYKHKQVFVLERAVEERKNLKLQRLASILSEGPTPANQCVFCGIEIPEGDHICEACKNK